MCQKKERKKKPSEIQNQKEFLAVGKACKAIFWSTLGLNEPNVTGFSAAGSFISVSTRPHHGIRPKTTGLLLQHGPWNGQIVSEAERLQSSTSTADYGWSVRHGATKPWWLFFPSFFPLSLLNDHIYPAPHSWWCVLTTKRKTFGEGSYPFTGPTVWNGLPFDIHSTQSSPAFRQALKVHIFSRVTSRTYTRHCSIHILILMHCTYSHHLQYCYPILFFVLMFIVIANCWTFPHYYYYSLMKIKFCFSAVV